MANLSIEPNELVTYKVAYEDDQVLVVVKPARVVTLPGKGHDRNTLLNGLFAKYGNTPQTLGREKEFGLLHRLDRETSGILLLAKSRKALVSLHAMLREGRVDKRYRALVAGDWVNDRQHVKLPLTKYVTREGELGERLAE